MGHKLSYYEKISLKHKTPEEAERIKQLFDDNINLANKIATKYYKTKYWDYDEALQIARMGLWKACLIWDPNKYRLSTLAYNIINRDFIDFDSEQKRQPDILFHMEDNCVTEDLSLEDVLEDTKMQSQPDSEIVQDSGVSELSEDILYILEDIADDLELPNSIVKIVYLTHIESNNSGELNTRQLSFIKKQTIKQIIEEFQTRLADLLKQEY